MEELNPAPDQVRYRVEIADAHACHRLVPLYAHLENALARCEHDLRRAYPGPAADWEIRWVPDRDSSPSCWRMDVCTPLLGRRFVAVGYWVTAVGSELEGVPKPLTVPAAGGIGP
ncbi:hypothetical protein BIV57_00755 [Mangrovactinospora gilvigrisea]|uniref:Uncharacterized protein n=1 Tax=Mangrovactinospora gilvigrisea TaxID=1428644 RepID=A0A1J7CCY3_9ACTN|nr:hypothetical protein [Mangrovactinospora gilvigrisea]OIV39404.1 hypothetical protein BIV57_00755 [Mangrovactinospora gilvigrisea]